MTEPGPDPNDLPKGYRWATDHEVEAWVADHNRMPAAMWVPLTTDSHGQTATGNEAELAVPEVNAYPEGYTLAYVEIAKPPGAGPAGEWFQRLLSTPCEHCAAHVFILWLPDDVAYTWRWLVTHRIECPSDKGTEGGYA